MNEKTEDLYEKSDFGENRKHFIHPWFGYGLFLPGEDEGIRYWNTHEFSAGLLYKYKLSNVFSTGASLVYENLNFRFDEETRIIDDNQFNDKEKLIVHGIGPEYYIRVNFDSERGNYMGNFIDLGVYVNWLFGSAYKTYNSTDGGIFQEKEITYKGLDQLNDFSYGATIRMAKDSFILFVDYRMSDLFDDKYNYINLPKYSVGLVLGLHR
jgi:hypothetical protein